MRLTDKGAVNLAKAIVVKSVEDYMDLNRWLIRNPEDDGTEYWWLRYNDLIDTRYFFFRSWFKELTNNHINPKWVTDKMDSIIQLPNQEYIIARKRMLRKMRSLMNDIWKIM